MKDAAARVGADGARTGPAALAPLMLLVFLLFVAIGGEVVQQLWNWLLPPRAIPA